MKPPSPALVVSLVALAVALGGTGYAVTKLPRNSVGTAQIKNSAVTGAKVKAASLEASDFRPGQLPAGPTGATGPQGAPGPQGERGAQGQRGPQGDLGPTFAFSDSQVIGSPADITTNTTVLSYTVAIPRAGRLTGTVTGLVFPASGLSGKSAWAECRVWVGPANVAISQITPTSPVTMGVQPVNGLMSIAFSYAVPAADTYTLSVRCSGYMEDPGAPLRLGIDRYDINGVLAGS